MDWSKNRPASTLRSVKSDEFKVERVTFGKAIRKFRLKAELTQEQLAARAGLTCSYIGMVERGQENISLAKIFRICQALNVALDQLAKEMKKHQA